MRILTVRQPWAWAIVEGRKAVENRTRNIAGGYRGLVAIHAGLRFDTEAWNDEGAMGETLVEMLRSDTEVEFAEGAIIGVANLYAVHKHDGSSDFRCCANAPWYTRWAQPDVWHLCLAVPHKLDEPLPYKGALGLRELPGDVAYEVLRRSA